MEIEAPDLGPLTQLGERLREEGDHHGADIVADTIRIITAQVTLINEVHAEFESLAALADDLAE